MQYMADKIRSFKDLRTWRAAYELSLTIYRATKLFPESEKFGLSNQLRRAAVSVASNIAEGFSRQGVKEKIQFYYMAKGSLSEIECQLMIAEGVGYISGEQLEVFEQDILSTSKMLSALLRSAHAKWPNTQY